MPVIHPSAFIASTASVMGDVTIGADASVWYGAVLRGDLEAIEIGDETNIQDLTMVHADPGVPCRIGRRVGVGHRAILHGCTIEDQCLIGMGSIILNGACVGTGSVIAAGALVPEGMHVPAGSLVMGVPGRIVRPVDAALAERIAGTWSRYVAHAKRHRNGEWPIAGAR
ncbi:MAG TPA: gamma carbonic anhydrase family protein [Gemmatimonadales bacterium]|nr:gamma carbonic anhydrase family protein [Gemmatimonadales bacterium]